MGELLWSLSFPEPSRTGIQLSLCTLVKVWRCCWWVTCSGLFEVMGVYPMFLGLSWRASCWRTLVLLLQRSPLSTVAVEAAGNWDRNGLVGWMSRERTLNAMQRHKGSCILCCLSCAQWTFCPVISCSFLHCWSQATNWSPVDFQHCANYNS